MICKKCGESLDFGYNPIGRIIRNEQNIIEIYCKKCMEEDLKDE